jgi:hypothetical protein
MLALGEPGQAERLLESMRTFERPLVDLVRRRPYLNLQSMVDSTVPHGWHYYWKSTGLRQLDDADMDTMVDHGGRAQSPWSFVLLFHLGGAIAEADPNATAYSRRDIAHELIVNAVSLPHQNIADTERAWARAFIGDLEPHSAGAYLNFLDHDDQHRTADAFRSDTYTRLIELQRQFDPDQVFQRQPAPPSPIPS